MQIPYWKNLVPKIWNNHIAEFTVSQECTDGRNFFCKLVQIQEN